jgi:hypothetical protein
MASKNARAGKNRNYMGHYEEELGCMPKYNYSNGFGWRSANKGKGKMERHSIRRKIPGMTQKQTLA